MADTERKRMQNDLMSAWWPSKTPANTAPPTALECVEKTVECLRSGASVPEPHASVLLDALLRYMSGSSFERALGIQRSQSGKPTEVQNAALHWRDSRIRELSRLVPGDCCKARAKGVAELLSQQKPQVGRYVQEAELIADELRLRQRYGLELPRSLRQLQRIIGGR